MQRQRLINQPGPPDEMLPRHAQKTKHARTGAANCTIRPPLARSRSQAGTREASSGGKPITTTSNTTAAAAWLLAPSNHVDGVNVPDNDAPPESPVEPEFHSRGRRRCGGDEMARGGRERCANRHAAPVTLCSLRWSRQRAPCNLLSPQLKTAQPAKQHYCNINITIHACTYWVGYSYIDCNTYVCHTYVPVHVYRYGAIPVAN